MQGLKEIGREIATQDNACTSNPIFAVQQKKRILGIDPDYSDNHAWVDDYGDYHVYYPGEEEFEKAEREYENTGDEPHGWSRTAYLDTWEFVTACFTRKGCEDYIRQNGHNLTEPRIYVYSAYRNYEWQAVRDFLQKEPNPDENR